MDVRVRFRLNKATGEVEMFEVADDGPMRTSEAEHNREHDRIATELGRVIERNPRIDEVFDSNEIDVNTNIEPSERASEEQSSRDDRRQTQ